MAPTAKKAASSEEKEQPQDQEKVAAEVAKDQEQANEDRAKADAEVQEKQEKASQALTEAQQAEAQAREDQEKVRAESVEKLQSDTVQVNEDGLVIGIDGKNPVSNENPDPRAYGR